MKRVEWLVWGGMLLTVATLGILAWRPPAAVGFHAGERLWWVPPPAVEPEVELTIFALSADAGGGRLMPVARLPDFDEAATGLRLAVPGAPGHTAGPSSLPTMPPRQSDDGTSSRFWTPDADAFDILGPRGGGRQSGWLERDVSSRQEAAALDREPAIGYDALLRPGQAPSDGGMRILQFESILGE